MHESLSASARAKRRREDGAVLLGIEEVLGEAGLDVARLLLARLLAGLRHLAPPLAAAAAPTTVLGVPLRRGNRTNKSKNQLFFRHSQRIN